MALWQKFLRIFHPVPEGERNPLSIDRFQIAVPTGGMFGSDRNEFILNFIRGDLNISKYGGKKR
jgi:hypothetical protein